MKNTILKAAAAVAATAVITLGGAGAAGAKVNEYEGQHRITDAPQHGLVGDPSQWDR
jgi:hypothetical protein